MAQQARTRPLVGKYAFIVRDPSGGIAQAKFQKCSGIKMTVHMGSYTEGGALAPMKEGTTAEFSNATLEHGVMEDMELYAWVLETINMLANLPTGQGVRSPLQLRNIAVDQLRRDRSTLRRTNLFNAQPADFMPGEHDNTSTDVQVETLELAYEYFTLVAG